MIFERVMERTRVLKTEWKEGGYETVNWAQTFSEHTLSEKEKKDKKKGVEDRTWEPELSFLYNDNEAVQLLRKSFFVIVKGGLPSISRTAIIFNSGHHILTSFILWKQLTRKA